MCFSSLVPGIRDKLGRWDFFLIRVEAEKSRCSWNCSRRVCPPAACTNLLVDKEM